jgi:RNA polymerase sigma factor (sigma-70 family)
MRKKKKTMAKPDLVQELKLELIREYERYVRGVAGLTGASEDDAREALHRAVCELLVSLKRRPAGNPALAWRPYVLRAAVYQLRNDIKERGRVILFSELDKDQRREVLSKASPIPTPVEQAEKNELAALAWKELGTLPRYERAVIARRCCGQSFGEIAATLDIKPSTARGFWTTGIATLRFRFRRVA